MKDQARTVDCFDPNSGDNRGDLSKCSRLVIKIGSSSLTRADGGLDLNRLDAVANAISRLCAKGKQVVLVSSGAIAAGLPPLGLPPGRPQDLATAQAAAAMGQGVLMAHWNQAFSTHHQHVAQVLLTADDVIRRQHYVNARRALLKLIELNVVPIINENDAVATAEIRFGDNDRLAALCTQLVRADGLLLLTDVDALYDMPPKFPGAKRISYVDKHTDLAGITVTDRGSAVGTGGMVTKLDAVNIATTTGVPVLLTSADNLCAALEGKPVGTWFSSMGGHKSTRQAWLAFAARSRGRLLVDEGAAHALIDNGSSLLAPGIVEIEGEFEAGDVVEIRQVTDGKLIARGLSSFCASEVMEIKGLSSSDIIAITALQPRPVVHRDHLSLVTH